jgi:predicted nucleic acid-binding protein
MRYLIDSNIWIYAAAAQEPAREILSKALKAEWAGYSAISRLEVLGYPSISEQEKRLLEQIMSIFVELPVDRLIIDKAIYIRQSTRIKSPDAIVAATAINMDATLISRNTKDFSTVPNLSILNPFQN